MKNLYNSEFWYKKRAEILIRDQYECHECENDNLYGLRFTSSGTIIDISKQINGLTVLNQDDYRFDRYFYEITIQESIGEKIINVPFVAKTHHDVNDVDLNEFKNQRIIYSLDVYNNIRARINDLKEGEKRIQFNDVNDYYEPLIIETPETLKYKIGKNFCVPGLHVHHLAYKKFGNRLDVPEHLLITLCPNCHQQKHPDKPIIGFSE